MENLKIDGTLNFDGGIYNKIAINGMSTSSTNIEAQSINVDGMFTCNGNVKVIEFECDGLAKIKGNIKTKTISVDGKLDIEGIYKLEADKINCDGMLKTEGSVSADFVHIDGFIEADEIVGENIIIKTKVSKFSKVFMNIINKNSKINLIEATTIFLEGITVNDVIGTNITIGDNCMIENLECNGELHISKNASVKNITGNYVIK